jgi:hypothetical protein
MPTVDRRIYDVDSEGRRFLLYRPGDVITPAEAKRVAPLIEPEPDKPGWMLVMERREPAERPYRGPVKPFSTLTLAELRDLAAAEGVDTTGGNTRSEVFAILQAARATYLTPIERQSPC